MKERLRALAGRAITTDGVLVVISRVHRTLSENREAARARLMTLLQLEAKPPKKRRPTRPRGRCERSGWYPRSYEALSKGLEAEVSAAKSRVGRGRSHEARGQRQSRIDGMS
jgi:ribosome-associated protein